MASQYRNENENAAHKKAYLPANYVDIASAALNTSETHFSHDRSGRRRVVKRPGSGGDKRCGLAVLNIYSKRRFLCAARSDSRFLCSSIRLRIDALASSTLVASSGKSSVGSRSSSLSLVSSFVANDPLQLVGSRSAF